MIYDGATGVSRGTSGGATAAVVADLGAGAPMGFVIVCAPGPETEAAGNRLHPRTCGVIVTELFSEMKFQGADPDALEASFGELVRDAAENAAAGAAASPGAAGPRFGPGGMSLMLVALFGNRLRWVAAGGATLLHARRGDVRRLDATAEGQPAGGEGLTDSGRAIHLKAGDTLLVLSRHLSEAEAREVRATLARSFGKSAGDVAADLLDALRAVPPMPDLAFGVARVR